MFIVATVPTSRPENGTNPKDGLDARRSLSSSVPRLTEFGKTVTSKPVFNLVGLRRKRQ